MANKSGPQPDIKHCPICKVDLHNIPRNEMKSNGYRRKDGSVAEYTHTYECTGCKIRFEINQDPLTVLLVAVLYIGNEVVKSIIADDNISQMAHIVGGLCGAAFGFSMHMGKKNEKS